MNQGLAPATEKKLYSIALALAVFTIVYNLAEGIIATWFGYEDETLYTLWFWCRQFY